MIATPPGPLKRVALFLGIAAVLAAFAPAMPSAAVIGPSLTLRAEGRAPVRGGRADTAYQQALAEACRRGLLDALRNIAPERQSPRDLETWQETILSRAGDFIGAWRIIAHEEKDGFLSVEAEIEVWRDKLARAARATGAAAAVQHVRVVVLSGSLAVVDRAADEEVDAGRVAGAALEVEMARRGAIIVATTDRAPWELSSGPPSEGNRAALAASAARRLNADAAIIAQLTRRSEGLALAVQLIAVASETTLVSARAEIAIPADRSLAEALVPAARQLAAACAPHLAATRSTRGRGALP